MGIKNSVTDVLEHAIAWHEKGHAVDLVTVVKTFGSSPRPVGSMAAIRHDGLIVGSVSGGCIEKQLVEQMRKQSDSPSVTYQITNEEAKRHGLMCGGSIELLFETIHNESKLDLLLDRISNDIPTTRTLQIKSGTVELDDAVLEHGFQFNSERLINVIGQNYHLILIGANELSRFTAEFALAVDFDVTVIDPRKEFRQSWPLKHPTPLNEMPDDAVKRLANNARCGVLALTHDPNLDDLALMEACETHLFYIGALGSTRSHAKRKDRLLNLDVTPEAFGQIHAPIGLDINSRTSAEIAVSIVAELITLRSKQPF